MIKCFLLLASGRWQMNPYLLPEARSKKPVAENSGTLNFILGLCVMVI
jgi:hypothetical protein